MSTRAGKCLVIGYGKSFRVVFQGILAAVLSAVLGSKDPDQVASMAKQAGEVGFLITRLFITEHSFFLIDAIFSLLNNLFVVSYFTVH